jgi:hypothetical protein
MNLVWQSFRNAWNQMYRLIFECKRFSGSLISKTITDRQMDSEVQSSLCVTTSCTENSTELSERCPNHWSIDFTRFHGTRECSPMNWKKVCRKIWLCPRGLIETFFWIASCLSHLESSEWFRFLSTADQNDTDIEKAFANASINQTGSACWNESSDDTAVRQSELLSPSFYADNKAFEMLGKRIIEAIVSLGD